MAATLKTAQVKHAISFELLKFIRDERPTEAALLGWLGAENSGAYHTLRKAGAIVCVEGEIRLSPEHYSEEYQSFYYENCIYHIDEEMMSVIRRSAGE